MPSGDHAGPAPPRVSIPIIGVGMCHASAPPVVEIVRIWLVPSRKRVLSGATPASATRVPSGDQVGAPGCGSESWIFVTVPAATSRTDISATRHMPSTLKNTTFLPSGENAAPCGCVVSEVTWRACPLFMSRIHSCSSGLVLSDE